MFSELDAGAGRLSNPSGKRRKAVAAKTKERSMATRRTRRSRRGRNPAAAKATVTKRTRGKGMTSKGKGRTRKGLSPKAKRRLSTITVRGKSLSRAVSKKLASSKSKRSVTYKQYKGGGAAITLRAGNPANQPKAVASFAVGALFGIVGSTMLDRWLATRATSQTNNAVQYGQDAIRSINAKPDGTRVFAQFGVGGVFAAGAYYSRKKMPLLALGMAGVAASFFLNGGFMVISDHVLPMLFKSKKAKDAGDRYFPDRQPPAGSGQGGRRLGGGVGNRPFPGEPTRIGPQATGSVGTCAACRSAAPKNKCSCSTFKRSPERECLDRVSTQTPQPAYPDLVRVPSDEPSYPDMVRVPGNGGDGRVPGDGGNGTGTTMEPQGNGSRYVERVDRKRVIPQVTNNPYNRYRGASPRMAERVR